MTVYGIFLRGVLISIVRDDDPVIAVFATRDLAEELLGKMRRPEQYHITEMNVIER